MSRIKQPSGFEGSLAAVEPPRVSFDLAQVMRG
jgi:hypothetical protein